jgi:hypothetical protein
VILANDPKNAIALVLGATPPTLFLLRFLVFVILFEIDPAMEFSNRSVSSTRRTVLHAAVRSRDMPRILDVAETTDVDMTDGSELGML